jgi:hypothetical protein
MDNWFIVAGVIVAVVAVLILTGKVAFSVLGAVINVAWNITKGIIKATISLVVIGIMLATIALGVIYVKANQDQTVNVVKTRQAAKCYDNVTEQGTYTICNYTK